MDGIPANHPFDGLMEISKDTAYSPSIEDIPWPDLHLECPGLLDSEIALPDTGPPETSTSLKNQFEGGNVFLPNDCGKIGEGASVTLNENASVTFDENQNADYHSFCTDIGSIMNDDDGLIASVMLDCLESNPGGEHLIADDPSCGQDHSSVPVDSPSPDPAPIANLSASSTMPLTTMTPLPSPTSLSMPIYHNDNTEDDAPMPQLPRLPPTPQSLVTLESTFEDVCVRTTSPLLPPHSHPPASGKQEVSGGASVLESVPAHKSPPSSLATLPAAALPSSAIPSSVAPSTPNSFPNSSDSHDELLFEVEDCGIKDWGPAATGAPVSRERPGALTSIFLQHEVPQSLFKGYLLARFPLNLAHKLEMTRLGCVQKRTVKIAMTKSGRSLDQNNKEAMEAAKVSLSSNKLGSGEAQNSFEVVIEPKNIGSSARLPDTAASEGGQFLRIPSRQERMARQRAPIPKYPMKIKCPMCKLTYKHKGTLKRHLITKHEYFDDVDIIP